MKRQVVTTGGAGGAKRGSPQRNCSGRRNVEGGMKVPVACVLLLPVLALAACSSSDPKAVKAPVSPPATSSTGAPSATPSGTQAPTPEATAGTPAATTGNRCAASALTASLGQSQGAAGHTYGAILITNSSSSTCTLLGYPGVSFTAGADAHQIGASAQRDNRFPPTTLTLAAGATVHATVSVADFGVYDRGSCRPTQATGFKVYPPGSTVALLVSDPQTVCANPGVQSFQISVVRSGTTTD